MNTKKLRVRIYPDGKIEAETLGVKGKKCVEYIPVLEKLLEAKTESSKFTDDYYVTESENNTVAVNKEFIR